MLDVISAPEPPSAAGILERNGNRRPHFAPEYGLPPSILLAGPKPKSVAFKRIRRTIAQHYRVFVTAGMHSLTATALRSIPDAIVIDASGASTCGFGIFNELRAHPDTRRIPVLAIADARQKRSGMTVISAGANDILFRPLAEGELVLRLSQLVALSETQRQLLEAVAQLQLTEGRLRDSARCRTQSKLVGSILQELAQPLARLAQALPEMHGFATSLPLERSADFTSRLTGLQQHLALARGLLADPRLCPAHAEHKHRGCARELCGSGF